MKFKQLFCRHRNNQVICWHYTHGLHGNEFVYIEAKIKCHRCGKYRVLSIRDREDIKFFEKNHMDKYQSSETKED